FILSFAVGVGLAWLFENLNTKVRNIDDINHSIQSPVLAVIPSLSEDSLSAIRTGLHELNSGTDATQQALEQPARSVSPHMLHHSAAADEQYRCLRQSVLLPPAGRPPRPTMITSAQPGDGKTTTVINTAIAFTKLKAEVLIVDCDMRKPTIHKLARLERGRG